MRRLIAAAASFTMFALLGVPHAGATFPGRNGRIAYSKNGRISLISSKGTNFKAVSKSFSGFVEAPQVSADGRWIVFDADNGSGTDAYRVGVDGTNQKRLTNTPTYDWSPSWSPDGTKIVYAKDGGCSPIMEMNADGSHRHKLADVCGDFPRFNPSGTKIVYDDRGDDQIHVMKANGSHDHAITTGVSAKTWPDWAPNGKHILYLDSGGGNVWMVTPSGGSPTQLTTGGNVDAAVFSPDGKWIAFESAGSLYVERLSTMAPTYVDTYDGCCLGWQPRP